MMAFGPRLRLAGAGSGLPYGATMPVAEGLRTRTSHRPIRIRTGHSYHVYFTIALGQRNARFVERALTPLNRYFGWADAMAFTPEPGFEAIHSWNAVPLMTRRPFIVTFEDYLPRTPDDRRIPWLEEAMRERLLSRRCVALIATSDYALRQFRVQNRDAPGLPALLGKLERLYPVVPSRTGRPKAASDRLRLLFVGRDFLRKGGPVLVRAHKRLKRMGIPVETVIVSNLQWSENDYVGPPNVAYAAAAALGIEQDGVVFHKSLPSAEVRREMDAADYLVFPTFHDTFGFVSLEALAGGTPVIASDTCVLPEIVTHGGNGFLLPFENDGVVGKWRWLYRTRHPDYLDAYEHATETMAKALVATLAAAWEDRREYQSLSAGALASAHGKFHPDFARSRLEELYERFRAC